MKILKTQLHVYDYDTRSDAGSDGVWTNLEIKLRHTPGRGHCMNSLPSPNDKAWRDLLKGGPVELETDFLFENQWNTAAGVRVFDWYLEYVPNRPWINRGHYLDITPEMIAIRRETYACAYCGAMVAEANIGRGLHVGCLGNVYLKEEELHLCRLRRICDRLNAITPLTKEEREYLLPLYLEAQLKTSTEARAKQRQEVLDDYTREQANITQERDGKLWLLDHGIQLENAIYYTHTRRFCFGWRSPYTGKARETILAALAKFPFPYDVR